MWPGVDIPNQKRIEFSLQYIFGIGPTTAKAILVDTVRASSTMCGSVDGFAMCLLRGHRVHTIMQHAQPDWAGAALLAAKSHSCRSAVSYTEHMLFSSTRC